MQPIIRSMQYEDLSQVAEIDRLSFPVPWRKDSFAFEIANPVSLCRVAETTDAEEQKRICGVMVTWIIQDEAEVATVSVHPDYRRQGIGRLLMETTLKTCFELGVRVVFLEVRRSNLTAMALYASLGFEFSSVRHGYYTDNHEDALVLTLEKLPIQPDSAKKIPI